MEIAHTDCPVYIEVEGSAVIHVPMEPASLVKEVLTEEDECVGIRELYHRSKAYLCDMFSRQIITRLLTSMPVYLRKFR